MVLHRHEHDDHDSVTGRHTLYEVDSELTFLAKASKPWQVRPSIAFKFHISCSPGLNRLSPNPDTPDFVLSGAVVERVESYKYLGSVMHATKAMTFATTFLLQLPARRCLPCRGGVQFWASGTLPAKG